jgi:uncharacterized RmlC-like cupin family protein
MSRRKLLPVGLAALSLVALSCGSKTGVSPNALGFNATTLAQGPFPIQDYTFNGKVEFTAKSLVYPAVLDFPQPAGENAPTGGHVHPPGFVYDLTGQTFVNLDDGSHITIGPGQAIFAPPYVHHTHSNPGPGPDNWLFLGVRTESVRKSPLPSPEAINVLSAGDLPPLDAGATYMLRLQMVTLRPTGQTPTTKLGGATLLYMLDGQNNLAMQGHGTSTMMFNHANFLPTGTVFQMRNPSTTEQSQVLEMTFWLKGQAPTTDVKTSLP